MISPSGFTIMADDPPDPERVDNPRTLIDALLNEQRQLTAVEAFARVHEQDQSKGGIYRDLIPLTAPPAGHQYAFEVDLDQCSGCKACVTACHSLNGLDEGETWREVGQLISNDWRQPFQTTVTTACHHCVDPGCLNGCPVLAYEKDPTTGIVRHLDDQCIGCQYCILKCPYEVPKYSEHRGIVRKCDMCTQRLAVGEAPACVQACPNEAIQITVVNSEVVSARWRPQPEGEGAQKQESETAPDFPGFLPTAPDPSITVPTTRYRSKRALPAHLIPADATIFRPQPWHWPLVFMLVFTQLAVGVFTLLPLTPGDSPAALAAYGLLVLCAGLGASVMHLGRPLKAWRSFLGWRRSWLSREILVFGLFAPLAALVTAAKWFSMGQSATTNSMLSAAAALIGLGGVFCSGMVYHDTHRTLWRGWGSVGRFFGTAAVLGLAATWMFFPSSAVIPVCLAVAMTVKLAGEHRLWRRAEDPLIDSVWPAPEQFDAWSLAQSARQMRDGFGGLMRVRFLLGLVGGILAPLATFLPDVSSRGFAVIALACCLSGEFIERGLFFRTVVPPRMPGSN
jgi:Fe-S-cluster-containing dehydrogenase component/DMSO reductase anchor subunit